MKTIAFMNFKGGVGKTITTATVAYILAQRYGKHLLLIDADSQGNLSQYIGVPAEEGNSTLELLESGAGYYPDFVTPSKYPNIDIIPAGLSLISADIDAFRLGRCNQQSIADLRDAIEDDASSPARRPEDPPAYDALLIDCPPAMTAACAAALTAADEVIIPVRIDAFSTGGMSELMAQLANMRRINDRLRLRGVLVTQFTRTREERDTLEYLRGRKDMPVFRTVIRYSTRVGAATFAQQPLMEYSPTCAASIDYKKFVEELEGGKKHGKAKG